MTIMNRRFSRTPILTGSCPVREHAGDGGFVGRCEFATYDGVCGRHGRVDLVPDLDDRELPAESEARDYGDEVTRAYLILRGFPRPRVGLTPRALRKLDRRAGRTWSGERRVTAA